MTGTDERRAEYARVRQRVCAEEGFHIQHGESICLGLAEGTPAQRRMLQDALDRWWEALLLFFGPAETNSSSATILLKYRFRTKTNEELRQKFLTKYVPRIRALGLTIPDPALRFDEATGRWIYTPPDWSKLKAFASNQGPLSQYRLGLRRLSYEQGRWVREAPLCPYCGSADTHLENLFGPTACRSIFHCDGCRQPFEGMRAV